MSHSKRLTPWTGLQRMLALLFLLQVAGLVAIVRDLVTTPVHLPARAAVALPVLAVVYGSMLVLVWRAMRVGVYAGRGTLRIRDPRGSRYFAWSQIASVDIAAARFRGRPTVHDAVWFTLADGRHIELPVWRRRRSDHPPAGAVLLSRGGGSVPRLSDERFDEVVRLLGERVTGHSAPSR